MDTLQERFLTAKRRLFDKYYGSKLNPAQCEAVFSAHGPLLVLAGAGSGKTTVLVNRIGYLIKYGNAYFDETVPEGMSESMVAALGEAAETMTDEEIAGILPEFISEPCPPWAMLAITFTNKAAREIRERLARTFDDPAIPEAITAGTFHSVCARILRKFGEKLGYRPGFSIYDTDDKKRLLLLCMKELGIDEKHIQQKTVANAVSMAKDRLEGPDEMDLGNNPLGNEIRRIYTLYQNKLMEYNAVDFDDIIMQTVLLLRSDAEVREYYQRKFRYVCVDEFQDTNFAQFELTKLLSGGTNNLMVVGDDDQSIYRFRGATVENILHFDRTYPEAKVIKLEQNYRSTSTILDAANAVIKHNSHSHEKALWCEKGSGEKIRFHVAADQMAEGRFIVDCITAEKFREDRKYSDFAVLYRLNELGRSLESTFAKSGIPYRILGAQRFTDRKEIRDMIAYLYLIERDDDDMRLKRVINEPTRGIGQTTVSLIETIGRTQGLPMLTVMRRAGEYPDLSRSAAKLASFCALIDSLRQSDARPSERIPEVFMKTGYREMLEKQGFEGEGRIEAVEEFVSSAVEYEKRCADIGEVPTLAGFLEEVALISDVDTYDADADAVVLMTVHSAKGLEFPVVFLAGMEEGIFPSSQSFGEPDGMSEERRLCYVALTRAKERLTVTCAKDRLLYGRTSAGIPSRFVAKEIPQNLLQGDTPKVIPPRATSPTPSRPRYGERPGPEFYRPANIGNTPRPRDGEKRNTPDSFGVRRFAPGARVRHALFGGGTVLSARDLGGDILYEVRFDDGTTKKLMATFAKLSEE